jgi:hypothetical protein
MSDRASALRDEAAQQLGALVEIAAAGPSVLHRPCPGREQLGDGTVGSVITHVADVYVQVAGFATAGTPVLRQHQGPHHPHAAGTPVDERMKAARAAVGQLGLLTDAQLDAVPAEGSMRFCDGRRTLEDVMAGVIRHQRHHVDAVLSTATT